MPLLSVRDLHVRFPGRSTGLFHRKQTWLSAVDGLSFDIGRGEIFAVVGESGCGKTTLANTLAGLETPANGSLTFDGTPITAHDKSLRRRIQMIFQDPYESLPPSMTVAQIVAEPLVIHKLYPDSIARAACVKRALVDAGLNPPETVLNRRPHELSGGQRQRVVIASALVLEPELILADEPVSMLDVSIRAGILNLFDHLRTSRNLSILLITHDLSTAAHLADRVAVMYLGRFVELGPAQSVLQHPMHPYTQALCAAAPIPDPRRQPSRTVLQGEMPDAAHLPPGCRFHPRCPVAEARCATGDPAWVSRSNQHTTACFLASPTP
ncbi:MAG: ABC transporter ATP-binding protein [bacterium]|nr:ABC transporter ATP-binding protein [bacterium]